MHQLLRFPAYYWRARTAFSMHSPILYAFCGQVLDDGRQFYAFEEIEAWRAALLSDDRTLDILDLGSGGRHQPVQQRAIRSVAEQSVSPPWKGRMLFRTMCWWKPDLIVELGTSLGISTAYLAMARSTTPVVTIDGAEQLHEIARKGWKDLDIRNITTITSSFSEALVQLPWRNSQRPAIYLDGDHDPTRVLALLEEIRLFANQPFLVIIDDIRWSSAMWTGWNQWQARFPYGAWVDLFQMGIWIHDPAFLQQQRQTLIPRQYKPFRLGWI